MHEALVEAQALLGLDLANLETAASLTSKRLEAARGAVGEYLEEHAPDRSQGEPLVVAFGSMARHEMTRGSDFDYLVVLQNLEKDPGLIQTYRLAAREALRKIALKEPGPSGLFGRAISAADLVNSIGLDGDTNLNLSRRVLLLEESVALNSPVGLEDLIESIVARYLYEEGEEPQVHRFLLNDIVRYWRTVAVDYQAKRWEEIEGDKWGLRYVKLLSSRKLTFVGSVTSLYMPVVKNVPATSEFLGEQFALPALARVAQLAPHLGFGNRSALAEVLGIANEFSGLLSSADFVEEVKGVQDPASAPVGTSMHGAKVLGNNLQAALEALFFSDEPLEGDSDIKLGALSRKYLSF